MNIVSTIFRTFIQFQIRNKSLDQLVARAEESGKTILTNLANKSDTPQSRQKLRHIIGIERWGQRRLKTLLGEPAIQDEYDGYQPAETLDFKALRNAFKQTRTETLALVRKLQKKGVAEQGTANHNGMGDVSVPIWLGYLTGHANFESKRIR
jgi:hypothetical protein